MHPLPRLQLFMLASMGAEDIGETYRMYRIIDLTSNGVQLQSFVSSFLDSFLHCCLHASHACCFPRRQM